MIVTTVAGLESALMNGFLPRFAPYPALVHLYTNDYTPVVTSVAGDFAEPAWPGYAAQPIGGWDGPNFAAGQAFSTDTPNVWTRAEFPGSLVNVYGYYVTDAGGTVLFAERFADAPVAFPAEGWSFNLSVLRTVQNA